MNNETVIIALIGTAVFFIGTVLTSYFKFKVEKGR